MDRGGCWQPIGPVFRTKGGDDPKVLFDPLVLPLRDPIGLGVERGGQILIDAQFVAQGTSKVGSEPGISIGDQLLRKSEPPIDMLHIELCYSGAGDGGGAGKEDCRPRTAVIDYRQDSVIALVAWEPGDEIHGNLLEGSHQ
jgi:hypothetical protein